MAHFTMDERCVTGHPGVDAAHGKLAELSRDLVDAVGSGASYEDVRDIFTKLHKVMVAHFELEERLMDRLPDVAEVRDHRARHKADHDLFRDTFTYADDKFAANEASREAPNIVDMIPEKYFEELKDLDAEMAVLLKRYDLTGS